MDHQLKKKIILSKKMFSISVCFGIGATICIGREIKCLPYAGIFLWETYLKSTIIKNKQLSEIYFCEYTMYWTYKY